MAALRPPIPEPITIAVDIFDKGFLLGNWDWDSGINTAFIIMLMVLLHLRPRLSKYLGSGKWKVTFCMESFILYGGYLIKSHLIGNSKNEFRDVISSAEVVKQSVNLEIRKKYRVNFKNV